MNGHTRRLSKGKGKTVSGKKRKSTVTVTTNDMSTSYSTNSSGTNDMATPKKCKHTTERCTIPIPGRDSEGKKSEQICLHDNSNNNDNSASSGSSIVDTTDDSNSDDESIAMNQITPQVKGGKSSNMDDGNCEVNTRLRENLEVLHRTIGEILYATAPVKSVVTRKPKRTSFSDLSNSQRTIVYFNENHNDIKRRFKVVILQETFGQMKFLMTKKEPPSAAEMIVLKAIDMKHVHVPKFMDTGEYVRRAEKYVRKVYSKLRSQVQQDLRQRWLGKL